jgi:hypothetical protein
MRAVYGALMGKRWKPFLEELEKLAHEETTIHIRERYETRLKKLISGHVT